jgi:leader peptidase (prepilin peptidase) / N-methyltransferase
MEQDFVAFLYLYPGHVEKRFVETPWCLWHSQTVVIAFFFLFGLVIGSFLNVCISRIPEGLSIVTPGSRCPQCHTPIKPYDNVPVFAWIWLRGKCRACGKAISAMYPLVELATGLLFVAVYESFGLTQATVKWLFFTCLIIILTITDLRVRLLPDVVTWPGFIAGLFFSAMVPPGDGMTAQVIGRVLQHLPSGRVLGLADGILGAAFGSLFLWGAATVYKLVRGFEGMGFGDVKMMAMVGAFLGLRGAFLTILLGTLLGSILGIGVVIGVYAAGTDRRVAERASRRGLGTVNALRWTIASQYQLPLGTFLGIAALFLIHFLPVAEEHSYWLRM